MNRQVDPDRATGALLGVALGDALGLPFFSGNLVDRIHDGPFGPTHLRALGEALSTRTPPPRWLWVTALLRNLALFPVILAHGLTRLWRR